MWTRTHAPKPLVDAERLQFYIEQGLNVLLTGSHGVGKTSLVRQAFEKAGKTLLVFSGPTMDPWVDFVGVPRPVQRQDGSTVLELIRRPELADDQVDAIFIDEFNRAPAKVRNAAMEVLQFGSVNGHRFNRLKCVWAAINPAEDDTYDTERLDPAQEDRFHARIDVPSRPCPAYFISKYASRGKAALEWWDSLGEEAKKKVSPRRLEYALDVISLGGPVRDVLPHEANVQSLLKLVDEGPLFDSLKELLKNGDKEAARKLMQDPNSGSQAIRHVIGSKAAALHFLPLLDTERLMALLPNTAVLETVVRYSNNVQEFQDVLQSLLSAAGSQDLIKRAEAFGKKFGVEVGLRTQPSLVGHISPLDPKELQEMDPYGRLTG